MCYIRINSLYSNESSIYDFEFHADASEKMDAMLSSDTAWLPLGTPELDELRVTECGESFLTLLLTITERYSSLPQPGHRLQFLELQLELLDEFRVRLLQLLHETSEPLNPGHVAILNTISYLALVLQEWGGLTVLSYNYSCTSDGIYLDTLHLLSLELGSDHDLILATLRKV